MESLPDRILSKLRHHQVKPVEDLLSVLRQHQSAVDLSDTGVGKTAHSAAVIASLDPISALVVCPRIVINAWHRMLGLFGTAASVIGYEALRTGRTPYGHWAGCSDGISKRETYFVCACCQLKVDFEKISPCHCHPLGIHCVDQKKKPQRLGNFVFSREVQLLVADEVHRCGALDSLNAEMLIAAKRQNIRVLGLSATAALGPLNMRALGYNLDLHNDKYDCVRTDWRKGTRGPDIPSFYRWANRHGCRRIPPLPGLRWAVGADKQIEAMRQIRDSIIPTRGVRVRVSDIPGFPERDISAELYDVDRPELIDGAYAEMAEPLAALADKSALDTAPENPLTIQLRARQRIELLKVPVAAELASDYLDKGYSIGIFVNFQQTLDELFKRFPGASLIYGGQRDREEHIEGFQSNFSKIIIVMSDAGGVGLSLPDLTGVNSRGGLVMPHHSAVTMRQIFGRFHRDDSKSSCFYRVLLAAGTVEEKIYRALNQKFSNLDALNDADMCPHE